MIETKNETYMTPHRLLPLYLYLTHLIYLTSSTSSHLPHLIYLT